MCCSLDLNSERLTLSGFVSRRRSRISSINALFPNRCQSRDPLAMLLFGILQVIVPALLNLRANMFSLRQPKKVNDVFYQSQPALTSVKRLVFNNIRTLKDPSDDENSPFHSGWSSSSNSDSSESFMVSTPRVNYPHYHGFASSTPKKAYDNRWDRWHSF